MYYAGGALQKTYTYTYDTVGNLLTASDGSAAHTYAYGDEQWRDLLTAYDGHAITYDQTGNPLTYYDGSAFTWKNGRQLASWTKNGQTTSYTYNADGLRTKKVNPDGSWSEYHWIGSTLISENRFRANGERHWTLQFQYDQNGSPVGVSFRDCGESTFTYVYYYAKNLQGDIVGLYKRNPDGTGAQVIATYDYDPWGKVTAVRDANGALVTYPSGSNLIAFMNPLRYRGYYQDNDTGFYYLQSRYYDPELKRFINADSYSSTGQGFLGHNMFAYCLNNPVMTHDEAGTRCVLPEDLVGAIRDVTEEVTLALTKASKRGRALRLARENTKSHDFLNASLLTCEIYLEFYSLVNHNAPWDVKLKES